MRFVAPSRSRNSSCVSQPRSRTTSSSIIAMCAAGPPNAVQPSLRKSIATSRSGGAERMSERIVAFVAVVRVRRTLRLLNGLTAEWVNDSLGDCEKVLRYTRSRDGSAVVRTFPAALPPPERQSRAEGGHDGRAVAPARSSRASVLPDGVGHACLTDTPDHDPHPPRRRSFRLTSRRPPSRRAAAAQHPLRHRRRHLVAAHERVWLQVCAVAKLRPRGAGRRIVPELLHRESEMQPVARVAAHGQAVVPTQGSGGSQRDLSREMEGVSRSARRGRLPRRIHGQRLGTGKLGARRFYPEPRRSRVCGQQADAADERDQREGLREEF